MIQDLFYFLFIFSYFSKDLNNNVFRNVFFEIFFNINNKVLHLLLLFKDFMEYKLMTKSFSY